MKNLSEYIEEKLIVNKDYQNASDLDELWDLLINESSLSWAGSVYSKNITNLPERIIKHMIHEYGRFSHIINNTYNTYCEVWQKYKKFGFTETFDRYTFESAVYLHTFRGMTNDRQSKMVELTKNINFEKNCTITFTDNNYKSMWNVDFYEDEHYLIIALDARGTATMKLKTMDSIFMLKKQQ